MSIAAIASIIGGLATIAAVVYGRWRYSVASAQPSQIQTEKSVAETVEKEEEAFVENNRPV